MHGIIHLLKDTKFKLFHVLSEIMIAEKKAEMKSAETLVNDIFWRETVSFEMIFRDGRYPSEISESDMDILVKELVRSWRKPISTAKCLLLEVPSNASFWNL